MVDSFPSLGAGRIGLVVAVRTDTSVGSFLLACYVQPLDLPQTILCVLPAELELVARPS